MVRAKVERSARRIGARLAFANRFSEKRYLRKELLCQEYSAGNGDVHPQCSGKSREPRAATHVESTAWGNG